MLPLFFSSSAAAPWCRDLYRSGAYPPFASQSPPPLPLISRARCGGHGELVAPLPLQLQHSNNTDAPDRAEHSDDGEEVVTRWLWQQPHQPQPQPQPQPQHQPQPQPQPQQHLHPHPQQAAGAGASAVYHQLQFEMQPGAKVKPSSQFLQQTPAALFSATCCAALSPAGSSPLSSPSASELELEMELLDRLCSEQSDCSSSSGSRDEQQAAPLSTQLLPLLRGSWPASASPAQQQPVTTLPSLPLPGLSLLPLGSLTPGTELDRCGRLPLLWLQREEKEVRVKLEGEPEGEQEEEQDDGGCSDEAAGGRSLLAATTVEHEPDTPQRWLQASAAAAASERGTQEQRARLRPAPAGLKRRRPSQPRKSAAPAIGERKNSGSSRRRRGSGRGGQRRNSSGRKRKQRREPEQDGCDSSSSSSSSCSSSSSSEADGGSESEDAEQPGSDSRRRPPSTASSASSTSSCESRSGSPSSSPCSTPAAYPHCKLLPAATRILRRFFLSHILYPFPSEAEKAALQWRAGLTRKQVCDWFTNNRKRYWRPYELRMTRIGCNLVAGGNHRRAQQQTGRCAVAYNDGVKRRCRCGSNHSALHHWRDMWD